MPCLFTNTGMGSELDWSSLLACVKILYAAWTGQMSGWASSATRVIDCHFLYFSVSKRQCWGFLDSHVDCPSKNGCKLDHPCCCRISKQLGWMFHDMFAQRVFMLIKYWFVFCAYSAHRNPVILIRMNQSAKTASSELTGDLFARSSKAVIISLVMRLRCLATSSSLSLARRIPEHMLAQSNKSAEC